MQSDDAAAPVEWDIAELRRSIDEWAAIALEIIALLDETAAATASQNWRPHRAQITAVVRRFRERCRCESEQLGRWREDGLAADEAYERVWDEADQLAQWLKRMMQP